jgi:hypothetical protein
MPVTRAFLYITFRVPNRGAPSGFPSRSAHRERCSVSWAPFQLSEFPVNGPLPNVSRGSHGEKNPSSELISVPSRRAPYQAPQWASTERNAIHRALLPISFRNHSKHHLPRGIPQQSSRKERCFISGALPLLSFIVPCQCTPSPRSPTGLLRRETPISRNSSFPQSPGKETPSMCPSRVLTERDNPSPEPMIAPFMSAGVPERRSPPAKWEKPKVTVNGSPPSRKAYIQWGVALFPKGIVNDTAVTTPVPWSPQQNTFNLGMGRPELR